MYFVNCCRIIDNSENNSYNEIRTFVPFRLLWKGSSLLSENSLELIKMIYENDNPEQALMTAAAIILGYLKQL